MGKETEDHSELIGLAEGEDPWHRGCGTGEQSPRRAHTSGTPGRKAAAVTLQLAATAARSPSLPHPTAPELLTLACPPCDGPADP